MKQIRLANGRGVVLIDDEDYERIAAHSWCLQLGGGNYQRKYAQANIKIDGQWKRTTMHRFIMGLKKGERCDHRDNDGLNNQKENLRLATSNQNQHNREKVRGRFKGVSWHKVAAKWVAQIAAYGKHYYLGLFDEEEAAARAYDAKAKELHGEFAKLNFRPGELIQ